MKLKSDSLKTILIVAGLSIILVVISCSSRTASAKERKVSVPQSNLPTVISKAIKEAFPNGQIMTIEKEIEGEDPGQYDVEIRFDGKEYEVEISPEGFALRRLWLSRASQDKRESGWFNSRVDIVM